MLIPADLAASSTDVPSGTEISLLSILKWTILFKYHCIYRADLAAYIAFYALLDINGMQFVRFCHDSIRRAALRTFGATYTFISNGICYKVFTFASRTAAVNMSFIFFSEIFKSCKHRIRS